MGVPEKTSKLDLNTLCFNTFLLMNIFNLLNCRVNTNELNIFTNLFNNMYFWVVFASEMLVQVAFIWFTKNPTLQKLLYTSSQDLSMILTAWIIGALILPLRALFTKTISEEAFAFMEKVNLETDKNDGCVTKCYAKLFRIKDEKQPELNDFRRSSTVSLNASFK